MPSMDFQDIDYQVDEPVATITLNRPDQLNAFTLHTLSEIRQAINTAVSDQRKRNGVTGSRERAAAWHLQLLS